MTAIFTGNRKIREGKTFFFLHFQHGFRQNQTGQISVTYIVRRALNALRMHTSCSSFHARASIDNHIRRLENIQNIVLFLLSEW